MGKLVNQQRMTQTLREYATQAVPDSLDGWPAIREAALRTSTVQTSVAPGIEQAHQITRPRSGLLRGKPLALPLGGLVLSVVLLGALYLLGVLSTGTSSVEDFVPQGKVRHVVTSNMTFEHYQGAVKDEPPTTIVWNAWYKNGPSHMLLYSTGSGKDVEGVPMTQTMHVTEDGVYVYVERPGGLADGNSVERYPFNPRWLVSAFAPNAQIISDSLKSPNTSIVGESTLNGRSVVELESTEANHYPNNDMDTETRFRRWIDKQEHRAVQWESVTKEIGGSSPGLVTTDTVRIILYEQLDESSIPPHLFTFTLPKGAKVYEREDPVAATTPTVLTVPEVNTPAKP